MSFIYRILYLLGLMNDMWRFNLTSMQWAFLGGSLTVDNMGTGGILGVECSICWPRSRRLFASFYDSNDKLYYIYGGNTGHVLADLWRWNVTSGRWTWLSGSMAVNFGGVYHSLGFETVSNMPNGRHGSVFAFDQPRKLFYLLFGRGVRVHQSLLQ